MGEPEDLPESTEVEAEGVEAVAAPTELPPSRPEYGTADAPEQVALGTSDEADDDDTSDDADDPEPDAEDAAEADSESA